MEDRFAPWQIRVIEEQAELSEKIRKLQDFFDTGAYLALSPEDQNLLSAQYSAMRVYDQVLRKRVARFD